MKQALAVFTTILLLALAGCGEDQAEKAEEPAAQSEPAEKSEPAATDSETESATKPVQESSAQDTETVTNNACLAAAKDQTGETDITVTSNEFSEANTLVMLGVGAQRAPWRCLVSNDGKVAELSFEGDDSAGAAGTGPDDTASEPNFDRPVGGVLPDGSGFTASGQIKCVRDKDAADAMCDFGVVREGNGNGWVMVFWPDTGSRVIYFEDGTPSSFDSSAADGDAELTATKEGDTNIVMIGDSRFEIPDAAINGG